MTDVKQPGFFMTFELVCFNSTFIADNPNDQRIFQGKYLRGLAYFVKNI